MALLQKREDSFLMISAVNAGLYCLLQNNRSPSWSKMVRQLLNFLLVQVRPRAAILVQVNANYKSNKNAGH